MSSLQVLLPLFVLHVIPFALVMGLPSRGATTPKVFVIGLSKTGTTSLGDAFELLNYSRSGWTDIWSRYLCHQAMLAGPNLRPVVSMSEKYQMFEDLPWSLPQVYTNMSKTYPDSKFILSLRKSEKVWLESMRRHTRSRIWEGHNTIYGAYQVDGNEEMFLKTYVNHMRDVRAFFATDEMEGRGMEMVIDAPGESDDSRWRKLVEFLGIEIPGGVETLGEFPRSNSGRLWTNKDPLSTLCGSHWQVTCHGVLIRVWPQLLCPFQGLLG
ncbi:uncharacterized protein LY89DRAFT_136243 [Mollisia scopiformis]|uniref:Sulfotransferase n=1 Tax=Mollisia scopiformis TaxID=149040 RepID=A0A194X2U6_MOLSC|nr:uncharacterized protein LY89DRAFT_136243 [Mollisia scopiformis]KUJ14344.1 hypothetical protein LY89DRAFT_136243 [Mollisia scopiformis]